VTCHNYGRFLPQCLDSLLRQTLPFYEIILVDDASEDQTFGVWQEHYRDTVKYLRVDFRQEIMARNWGIRNSAGDFIVCVDADDWLSPRYHEAMRGPLLQYPGIGFTYCGAHHLEEKSSGWHEHEVHRVIPFYSYQLWRQNFLKNAILLRRKAWRGELNCYGVSLPDGGAFAEDWDHALSMVREGWQGVLVDEKLIYYRVHQDSQSWRIQEKAGQIETFSWKIREKYLSSDLTIIVFISEMNFALKRCVESLKALEIPSKTQMIFIDKTVLFPESAYLRAHCTEYVKMSVPEDCGKRGWKEEALYHARCLASGREVLLLDSGLCLFPDAYRKLSEGKKKTRADFYSARVVSTMRDSVVAWRAVKGNPDFGCYFTSATRMSRRVYATGFHALLMDARIFHDLPLEPKQQVDDKAVEFKVARWAWDRNLRWFVNGRIPGRRLGRDGEYFRMGQFLAGKKGKTGNRFSFPNVSIVVLAKGKPEKIHEMLESLRDQDYPKDRMEIFVVCRGGFENCNFRDSEFPEVKFLREETTWLARNRIILETRNEYVAFISGDGTVGRMWLQELLEPFFEDLRTGAVAGSYFWNDSGVSFEKIPDYEAAYCGIFPNILYRREALIGAGLFKEAEDWLLDIDATARLQRAIFSKVTILQNGGTLSFLNGRGFSAIRKACEFLGERAYEFFGRHPEKISPQYHRIPMRNVELALRLCKLFLTGRRKFSLLPKSLDAVFLGRENLLGALFCELGYVKRMRKKIDVKSRTVRDEYCVIFLGESYLMPSDPVYQELWDIAVGGVKVLYVNLSTGFFSSWYQAILSFLKGTTVWHWHPRLLESAGWKLFAGDLKSGNFGALNILIAKFRVNGQLNLSAKSKILLAGEYPENILQRWKEKLSAITPEIQLAWCTPRDSFLSRPSLRDVFRTWNTEAKEMEPRKVIRASSILSEKKCSLEV